MMVAILEHLLSALDGKRGSDAADRLCEACVMLLDIDAAAISLLFDGAPGATLGSSSAHARVCDELQFTLGEGPCLESVATLTPVLVADLADPDERRWPVYGSAMLELEVRGVYAMPVVVSGQALGALDLFRALPGPLNGAELSGAVVAAGLAGVPLLDLLDIDLEAAGTDPDSTAWLELNAVSRAEISQATGMLIAQLGLEPAEALLRLRSHAYMTNRSTTDVARDILARRLRLEGDEPRG
jgi:hypothetical protein